MKTNYKNTSVILAILMYLLTGTVFATLHTGSVTKLSGNNISSTSSSTVTVRWTMGSVGTAMLFPGSVISSSTGRFTNGMGLVLAQNNKILSKTINPTIASSFESITETVRIPKSVLYKASKLGLKQISYERTFTDCPGDVCNVLVGMPSATFNLVSGASTSFNVNDYNLRFDNGKITTVVGQGDKLNAIVQINVSRIGTIRGVWEVATPATTAGQPMYKVIRSVQGQLTNFSVNQIKSPNLPTDMSGIYLLRFRFTSPELEGTIPTLRYNVTVKRDSGLRVIKVSTPENGAIFTLKTRFEWVPIPGAHLYKLEFIHPPADMERDAKLDSYEPVAGLLVKSTDTKKKINMAVAAHLKSGRIYWWHVIGLDKSGAPVGESIWSSIKIK